MRDFAIVFVHLIVTLARLARLGGLRSVVAESVLVRHQLLILNRGCKRAPNLRATDRIIAGLCALFMRPARVVQASTNLSISEHSSRGAAPVNHGMPFRPALPRVPLYPGGTPERLHFRCERQAHTVA